MPEPTGFDANGNPIVGAKFLWKGENPYVIKEVHGGLVTFEDNYSYGESKYPASYLKDTHFWKFAGFTLSKKPRSETTEVESKKEVPTNPYALVPVSFKPLRNNLQLYTKLEEEGRNFESHGLLELARESFAKAQARMTEDLEMDSEERALSSGKILKDEDYQKLGKTDKAAWDMKQLRKGKHYVSQLGYNFLFWE